ncbi:WD40-repeat-containing domain superfamily protein [Abortiporus biennis]
MTYSLRDSIKVPAAVSALSFGSQGNLAVGSADGSVRVYKLPSLKVLKAIRQLGDEVSSICWLNNRDAQIGEICVASGRNAYSFNLDTEKLILAPTDALVSLELGEDDEDVVNELNVNENKKYLSFSSDAGSVGIVDLSTRQITRMKTRHNSICDTVKFVPHRSSEIVSGGYDSAILHHDFFQRNLLSRFDITAAALPSSGVSLSPPFVLSLALSPCGLIAAGTADGRIWLGAGGDKATNAPKRKKGRKWEGLQESEGTWIQVADGPIVAAAFTGETTLIISTLLGRLVCYSVSYDNEGHLVANERWQSAVEAINKVNAIAVNQGSLVVGGLDEFGKGIAEVWSLD